MTGRRARKQMDAELTIATLRDELAGDDRRGRLAYVTRYVQAVFEQVEARIAAGETAAVAYPEALRHELERLRRATE